MKKIIKYLFSILLCFIVINPVFAQKTEKIAVFPVDVAVQGSSITLYPNILNLISSDVINALSKKSYLNMIDLNSTENLIKSHGLQKKYQKLLLEYKSSYTLDYDNCALIAKKIGASKILLVSGGFDLQKFMMERGFLYKLDIPTSQPLIPTYRLNITFTLIDPDSGIILWEDTYKKNFKADDFPLPSQLFTENIVSVEKIKKFSYELSEMVSLKMTDIFMSSAYTEINSNIITTKTDIIDNGIISKDGITTKDGHSSSTNQDYLLNKRMDNYKKWVKEKIFDEY